MKMEFHMLRSGYCPVVSHFLQTGQKMY